MPLQKIDDFLVKGTVILFKESSFNRHLFATMYTLQSFVFKNDIIEQEIEFNGLDRMKFSFLLWLKAKVKQSFLLELTAKCYLFLTEINSG